MPDNFRDLIRGKKDGGRIKPMTEFPSVREAFDKYFTPKALKPISDKKPATSKKGKQAKNVFRACFQLAGWEVDFSVTKKNRQRGS